MRYPRGSQERDQLQSLVVRKYRGGQSIRSIASDLGKSYGLVHNVLEEAGVEFRPRGGANRVKQQ